MKPRTRALVAVVLGLTMLSLVTISISLGTLAIQSVRPRGSVSVSWEADGGISLRANSDGPFLVTHLIKAGYDGLSVKAALNPTLALTESGTRQLSAQVVRDLVWVEDLSGSVVNAPDIGHPLRALYLEGRVSRKGSSDPR